MILDDIAQNVRRLQEVTAYLPTLPRITVDPSYLQMMRQAEQFTRTIPDLVKRDPRIVEEAQRVASMLDDVRRSPLFEAIQRQRDELANLDQLANLWEESERQLVALEPDAARLGAAGWTIPLWAPIDQCRRILHRIPPGHLDKAFVRHYSKDEGKASRELFAALLAAPGLDLWRPLIRQCIATYRRRQYLVTVPSLLLTLEGAVARATRRTGTKMRDYTAEARTNAKWGTRRLIWASVQSFMVALYAPSDFAQSPPDTLNRHWALHGRERPEYTKADCLRLFQAIHTISPATEV
jgi:hypothetical protein